MKADIRADIERLRKAGLLELLLKDRTTGKKIVWATDGYSELGEDYGKERPMLPSLVHVVQCRAMKEAARQTERTRRLAEVFTPLWICKKMNDAADEVWFGQKVDFDAEKIEFPKGKKWQHYIDAKRLEITCGEAPFLVNRYDAADGEVTEERQRTGMLDRKLRVASENAETESEFLKWAKRAVEAVYGYEFQGDNLLIARVNILMTYADAVERRLNREPTLKELTDVISVVCANLWQMDGLTGTVPYAVENEADTAQQTDLLTEFDVPTDLLGNPIPVQTDLFGMMEPEKKEKKKVMCRVYDWRSHSSHEFLRVKEGKNPMKFDFIIGNPPYQEEIAKKDTTNGQKRQKSIFHYFQMQALNFSDRGTLLIYPAARWIHRSGKGLQDFGLSMINDRRLSHIVYYPDASEIFPTAEIADGISIVLTNQEKTQGGFKYSYAKKNHLISTHFENPGEVLIPLNPSDTIILQKIDQYVESYHLQYMHDGILSQKFFGVESNFIEMNPSIAREYISDEDVDFHKEVKLFANDKSGKAGRSKWFVVPKTAIPEKQEYISQWQVVVSSANAGGQKRDSQLEIIDNHSAFGRSRVALRSFETKKEAENFYKYVKSYIVRYAFLMTDEALTSLGKRVPDILDYTDQNGIFDFSADINAQFYKLVGLTDDEIDYIEERVNSIRG